MSISDNDVKQALVAMREAMNTLARAIEAQSTQVRELAEENQRLHDTVKNRDETIDVLRSQREGLKEGISRRDDKINQYEVDNRRLTTELERSRRDCDELLKANLEASDEIKGLRQLILEVTLTTAKANEVGKKATPDSNVTPLPSAHDPATNYGG